MKKAGPGIRSCFYRKFFEVKKGYEDFGKFLFDGEQL